jgi:hypothetical protein
VARETTSVIFDAERQEADMKEYTFKIAVTGTGDDAQEALDNAIEALISEPEIDAEEDGVEIVSIEDDDEEV